MNKKLVKFEFEKSPFYTIVYGATGTGKTYFVRQYLKLYIDGNASAKAFDVPLTDPFTDGRRPIRKKIKITKI